MRILITLANVPVLNLNDFYAYFKNNHKDKSTEYTFVFITDCKFAFLYSSIKELGNISIFFIWLEQKGKFNEFVQARIEIDKFIRFKTIPDLEKFTKEFKIDKTSKARPKRSITVSPDSRKTLGDNKEPLKPIRTSTEFKIEPEPKKSITPIPQADTEETKAPETLKTENIKTETIRSESIKPEQVKKELKSYEKTTERKDSFMNEVPAARHLDDSQSQIVQPMLEGSIRFETLINNFRESQVIQREDLSEYNEKVADPQSFRYYYESRINMLNDLLPKQTDMMRNLIDTNLSFERELSKLKAEYNLLIRTLAKSKNSIKYLFIL